MATEKKRIVSARTKQLSIECEDRPGTLVRLTKIMGRAKANIVAISCASAGVLGAIHLVVDDVDRAKKTLNREGVSYTEQEVLRVEMPNLPGCLGEFAEKLAKQEVNITTAYGSASKGSKRATVVFKVSDLEKAAGIR
jgi:hypothetical protein